MASSRPSSIQHERPETLLEPAKRIKVLIVDDNQEVLSLLDNYLDHTLSEFAVITARTGEQALELIMLENPGLMIADTHLRDFKGGELIRQALKLDGKLRIIAMSASGTKALRDEVLEQGALRYVEKPFDLPALYQTLTEIALGPPWDPAEGLCGDAMDAIDVTQMMALCRQSGAIQFQHGDSTGLLVYQQGTLVHASSDGLGGEEAFYRMARRREGLFHALPHQDLTAFEPNIQMKTEWLLLTGARLKEEASPTALPPPAGPTQPDPIKEAIPMAKIKELLNEMLDTQGARVAVIVGWDGFVIEGVSKDGAFELDALGAVISTSMGSSKVIGRELKVGDIALAMMEFEKGTVLVRALGTVGLLAMMVDPDTSLGLPRHQIRKWAPTIEAQLA